jgi:hypothetical protein
MVSLPKKTTPQEWTDVVLPLFEQPEPEKPKPRSKKQDDDAKQVKWRRRPKGARQVPCHDCSTEQQKGQREGIGTASYIRIEGSAERYLCFQHRAEYGFAEDLQRGSK